MAQCLGNIHELCAKKISKETFFDFTLCLNKDARNIGISEAHLASCLEASNISPAPFHSCVRENGRELLMNSVSQSAAMNIK